MFASRSIQNPVRERKDERAFPCPRPNCSERLKLLDFARYDKRPYLFKMGLPRQNMNIRNMTLDNPLVLAPMAGYTDVAFRLLVKEHQCALVTSEMVSADGLLYDNRRTRRYLISDRGEAPLSVQIFGSDPVIMAKAAEITLKSGADGIDINMGCPVKKVVKRGAGAALMRDVQKAGRLLTEVRKAVDCALTVKIRAGWSADELNALDVALAAEDAGVDAIAVHPRTASQGFNGNADWDIIKEVKKRVSLPVIGNGDVREPSDAIRMMEATGCDAVMIGRASLGAPWIFSQTMALLRNEAPRPTTLRDRRETALRHFTILKNFIPEDVAVRKMRGQVMRYIKGLPNCSSFRTQMQTITTEQEYFSNLTRYFSYLEQLN